MQSKLLAKSCLQEREELEREREAIRLWDFVLLPPKTSCVSLFAQNGRKMSFASLGTHCERTHVHHMWAPHVGTTCGHRQERERLKLEREREALRREREDLERERQALGGEANGKGGPGRRTR